MLIEGIYEDGESNPEFEGDPKKERRAAANRGLT
jgi:hypothetical protein